MFKENFVLGKIYSKIYKADSSNQKYYYIGPNLIFSNQGIFQRIPTGDTYSFPYESSAYEWKEYKESRKGTRWMNVYSSLIGNIYTATHETKEQADRILQNGKQRIACVEVPWVEGQGL